MEEQYQKTLTELTDHQKRLWAIELIVDTKSDKPTQKNNLLQAKEVIDYLLVAFSD